MILKQKNQTQNILNIIIRKKYNKIMVDSDDFKENAFKFSVKTYLSNVFESLLDESLYYLEKERSNVLRDEQIQKVTNEFQQKTILEDICTADGSIMVLARYLLTKTKK